MSLSTLKWQIEGRLRRIEPNIVMGDDDSIHLTAQQVGEKVALEWVLEQVNDMIADGAPDA